MSEVIFISIKKMHRRQHSSTKCTRIERLAQLSEQEIVIEKKKREIQAKIEAQKKKETEEALKKLESVSESKTRTPSYSTKTFWRRLVIHFLYLKEFVLGCRLWFGRSTAKQVLINCCLFYL